jgi:hypothetical protein
VAQAFGSRYVSSGNTSYTAALQQGNMVVASILCFSLALLAPLNVAEKVTPVQKVLELMNGMLQKGIAAKKR